MLVGFQCQLATEVAAKNRERDDILYLKNHLLDILDAYDRAEDMHIAREDFKWLLSDPEFANTLDTFGTDIGSLATMAEQLFQDEHAEYMRRFQRKYAFE